MSIKENNRKARANPSELPRREDQPRRVRECRVSLLALRDS